MRNRVRFGYLQWGSVFINRLQPPPTCHVLPATLPFHFVSGTTSSRIHLIDRASVSPVEYGKYPVPPIARSDLESIRGRDAHVYRNISKRNFTLLCLFPGAFAKESSSGVIPSLLGLQSFVILLILA